MSLEEYEAIMAEKKKALNKQAESKKSVDVTAEFKGLKAFTKVATETKVRVCKGGVCVCVCVCALAGCACGSCWSF